MAPSSATLYPLPLPSQEDFEKKVCNTCYQRLPVTEFEKANHGTSLQGDCKACRRSKRRKGYQKPVFLAPPTSKICAKCGTEKLASEFTHVAANPSGLHSYCKECKRIVERTRVDTRAENKRKALRAQYEKMAPSDRPLPKICGSDNCLLYKELQPPENFDKSPLNPSGLRMDCRLCELNRRRKNPKESSKAYHNRWYEEHKEAINKQTKAWREANPQECRRLHIERRFRQYGVTQEWYDKTLAEQGGRCAMCGSNDPQNEWNTFHVDHDHSCCSKSCHACDNCRRGLLCSVCNTKLGVFEKSKWVKLAKAYLAKYKRKDAAGDDQPSLFDEF